MVGRTHAQGEFQGRNPERGGDNTCAYAYARIVRVLATEPIHCWARKNMKHWRQNLLIVISVLACCCNRDEEIARSRDVQPNIVPCKWAMGDTDDQGRLVVFVAGGHYEVLETDYALAFVNMGDHENPITRFNLSSRESGFETFDSLESLTERVHRIQPPRTIDFYQTCGAPPWYGISQSEIDKFFSRMDEAEVDLRRERPNGGYNFICTCP
jgi:hypothetical protein